MRFSDLLPLSDARRPRGRRATRSRAAAGVPLIVALGALAMTATACSGSSPGANRPVTKHSVTKPQGKGVTTHAKLSSTHGSGTKPGGNGSSGGSSSTPGHLAAGQYDNERPGLPHWVMAVEPLAHGFDGAFSFIYQDGHVQNEPSYTASVSAGGRLTITFPGGATYAGSYSSGKIQLPGCTSYLSTAGGYGPTPIASCTFRYEGGAPGSWTSAFLVLSPSGLGDVKTGMSLTQAQAAAGETFNASGDGFAYEEPTPPYFADLWVGIDPDGVRCVGAAEPARGLSFYQSVVTPEGFALDGTVQQLLAVYGSRAKYVPNPGSGLDPVAGYVVDEGTGRLVFWLTPDGHSVIGMAAGDDTLEPSYCLG
jgi:hypothetical protein